MTLQSLPESPNLEQLKKRAKSLLHAAQARDPAELARFRVLPTLATKSVEQLAARGFALHDAQSVIAREHGFKSWNELREHVEERSLTFTAAIDEFLRCATGGAPERALRLLALHPGIAHANLFTELVLGDAEAVRSRLQKQPEAATRAGGPQAWEPLLYVCHTCLHQGAADRAVGIVDTARELLERGADPNSHYQFKWHPELPRTVLWGALCVVRQLPLAQSLLESGANPTDGVSTHINAGLGNLDALDLLHRFNLDVDGIPGGVPPLRYILSWVSGEAGMRGVRWLLEHGANPNLAWAEMGDAPLHIAAQRCDVPTIELLVQHGADIQLRRSDGRTAHTLAELHGNKDAAAWLLAHGARDERSTLERFISACAAGNRIDAAAMLQSHPALRSQLVREHHLMMHAPAERGDARVLEVMLACGFDPSVKDKDGVTALHVASMAGQPDSVRVLLAHGAPPDLVDDTFAATPLVWAAEAWQPDGSGRGDHLAVARLLAGAGSPLGWTPPENTPNPERGQEKLMELCRAAGVAASD